MISQIDIDLPVRPVYDQWTQFEEFPLFMAHVDHVRQLGDDLLEWQVTIMGVTRSWQARITEQTPDQRVAWTATDGTRNGGVVTFHALADDVTRVVLQLEIDPDGFLETVGDKLGFVRRQAEKDLEAFKDFIEHRRAPSGSYRGTIERNAGVVDDGRGGGADEDDRAWEDTRRERGGPVVSGPAEGVRPPAGDVTGVRGPIAPGPNPEGGPSPDTTSSF